MGLEVVEFIMEVEKAFGLSIPGSDTKTIATPREFVAYLKDRLPGVEPGSGEKSLQWTTRQIEQVVKNLLEKTVEDRNFTLDTPFREIFP